MTCYSPLRAYKGGVTSRGKQEILWRAPAGTPTQTLPCGKCIGCKLAYSKSWAIRCMHEAQMHDQNSFVTLTYDEDHLPADGNLRLEDFQLFMKRLRKRFGKCRFFHAGEYGGRFGRPHYHAILFGLDFPDKVLKTQRNGYRFFASAELERLWPFGFHSIGDVTVASASYVARYCVKKATDRNIESFTDEVSGLRYWVDSSSGELRRPEYTTMSRRPGIGLEWYRKFKSDVYPSDSVVLEGFESKPPRFYDNQLDKEDPDLLEELKRKRCALVPKGEEASLERLAVKEFVKMRQIQTLKRTLGEIHK